MTVIHLRKATGEDLDALATLEAAVFPGDRISRRSWRSLIKSPSAFVVVACGKTGLLGSAVMLVNARTTIARLYSIAVAPPARRFGIAQALIEDTAERAGQAGASQLRLETRYDNIPAQRLFIRLGFKPFKRVPAYYEDGGEAIRYQRLISSRSTAPLPESRSCPIN